MAGGDGSLSALVHFRLHDGRRYPPPLLLPPGHRRARRRPHRLLHRYRIIRLLGDPPRRIHLPGLPPGPSPRREVPRSQRPGLPHDRHRFPLDLPLVLRRHRRTQFPLPSPHHHSSGPQHHVDRRGDAKRSQFDGEQSHSSLLPERNAIGHPVQLPASHFDQSRQRLSRLPLRADHRVSPDHRPRPQSSRRRGRVHVLLRPLLPQRHGIHLSQRQQLGLRSYRGVWKGIRGGVAEYMGNVREGEDGGAGGLGHHQRDLLPFRGVQRGNLCNIRCLVDLLVLPQVHRHRLPSRLLRRLSHDEDWNGAAARVRGVLLLVLCGEPRYEAFRLDHPGPARDDPVGPGRGRVDASIPPAHLQDLKHWAPPTKRAYGHRR